MTAPALPWEQDWAHLPIEGKASLADRMHALRASRLDPTGPYGPDTRARRAWPRPGKLAEHLDPTTRQSPALNLLDRKLLDVADGRIRRLMFFMPPQEGKSQRVSRRFPVWLLAMDPTLRIVITSYEKGRAERWGRWCRRDVEAHPELGVRLRQDSRAAGAWQTTAGGGLYCVGIEGAITGEPADVLIIDDPVKGRAEAESPAYRERAWDFWEGSASVRLSSRGRVVLIMTRWHEDDLAGRLQVREPGKWHTVLVPAIAAERDPIGRRPGQELVSVQRREPGYFLDQKAIKSQYTWNSEFQQNPTAAEGNLFRRDRWGYWRPTRDPNRLLMGQGTVLTPVLLTDTWRFATIDLAASTRTSADWTVVSVWALTLNRQLLLLDRGRARMQVAGHAGMVLPLTQRWQLDTCYVEESFISSTIVRDLTRAGLTVTPVKPEGDKTTRALPAAERVNAGMVMLPAEATWLDEWMDELAQFPNGTHDDQVDTLSYAVRVTGNQWAPIGVPSDSSSDLIPVEDRPW